MWALVWGWSVAAAGPADTAVEALVAGRDRVALQALRSAVRNEDDPDSALRCLLGEVALQVGRADEALDVLSEVPADAPCHGRAAFVMAEALRANGDLDEAATRYRALTEELVSPTGPSLAGRLVTWADRLLAEEPPDRSTAVTLLHAATELDEGLRLDLARRIAVLSPQGAPRELAIRELSAAITANPDESAADRRRLSLLVDASLGRQLLQDLPDDPETMAARVEVAAKRGLATRYALAKQLIERHPDADVTEEVRLAVGQSLAVAGWVDEATSMLAPLAEAGGKVGETASWTLVELALMAGADDAAADLGVFLERFPTSRFRSTAEERVADLSLRALRAGEGPFDGDAWDGRIDGPALALEAAWAADGAERLRRLDELIARWPWSPQAAAALRHRALDEGLDWLEERSGQGAADQVLAELREPEIGIRTPKEVGAPTVELLVRGLEEVELRLHRVDVEGWLRAGGTPDSLGELDVAIVAPDARWTVSVPDEGPEVRFEVPVPVPGPGLYSVTAATTDREARTLLLVSGVELMARAQGEDLALVALRDGVPVPRAGFWIRDHEGVKKVSADAQGLARATIASAPVVVVAETPAGPAVLEVGHGFGAAADPVQTAVDLDRPGYRPGDVVRFRALATQSGAPLRGKWRVSLVGPGGLVHQVVRTTADRNGTVQGEVVVPWASTSRLADGAGTTTLTLIALPPGQDHEVHLANVVVVEDAPAALRLTTTAGPDGLVIVVQDGQGVPVSDHPVELSVDDGLSEVLQADGSGRLRVPAPPAGVPWTVVAQLPDHPGSRRTHHRSAPVAPEQRLWLDDPRAAPGEPVSVGLEGEGEALLRVVRLAAAPKATEPVSAPNRFDVPSLEVFRASSSDMADEVATRRTISEQLVSLADGAVQLPGLESGRYRLELVRPDADAGTLSEDLEVREGTRVRLDGAPVVGGAAEVAVDGGWALVTAEGGRMLDAQLVPPGRRRAFDVDRGWHGSVAFVATTPLDHHTRRVDIDAALKVELEAKKQQGRWAVTGQVTDAAGNPVAAQVVVRAVDEQLLQELGSPSSLGTWLLQSQLAWSPSGAFAGGLRHGGWSEKLAAALLDEAARVEEKKRAELASQGRLAESRVAQVLESSVPLEVGGLGTAGYGQGGGGSSFGSKGSGSVGMHGGSGLALGAQGKTLRGHRDVGLWRVVNTDRDGRFVVNAAAPDVRASWRVEAVAVSSGSLGTARAEVEASDAPWVAIDALQPGWLGDVARPRAHVVNPSDETVEVDLSYTLDGAPATAGPWTLAPGEVAEAELGDLDAGRSVRVELRTQGRVLSTRTLAFELAAGPVAPDGPVRISVTGRTDGTVVGAVALLDEPMALSNPARAIVAGREALAALPALTGDEQREALVRVWGALGVARSRAAGLDVRGGAQALLLVAEAAEELELPRDVVEAVASSLRGEPDTPQERLELAYARAVAEVPVQEATVGRLLRDAERLDPEGRALLLRLLGRLGPQDHDEWAIGEGPQAILATREGRGRGLDPRGVLTQAPPERGDPARPDWIRALVLALDDQAGVGDVGLVRGTTAAPDAVLSWAEATPEGDSDVAAARWPAGLSGRPVQVAMAASPFDDEVRCGSEADPCRIAVGEALQLRTDDGWLPSGGLRWSVQRRLLVATTPGRFVLRGLPGQDGRGRGLVVEVVEGDEGLSPLGPGEVLALAQRRLRVGDDVGELLASRPSLEDWSVGLRASAAQVRFAAADSEDAAGWIAAFEDLRDEVPSAPLEADDVVVTAGAYHRLGRPERAIAVYERAIGQAFLSEAAVAQRMGHVVGDLAALQALRDLTLRYPAVPMVDQAAFALPDRLLSMVGGLSDKARAQGITDTELRLMAAAWDRRFVALAPDSELAPEAGLRLATVLVELGAEARALSWVERLQQANPDHELVDRWMLLEALVLTELGRSDRARSVLERLAEDELPLGGGRLGPSMLRDDARLSLGRLAEAERRWDAAADWYRGVLGTFPEAGLSVAALERVTLEVDEPLVVHPLRSTSKMSVRAANVDTVHVRAYAVDLRTLFLREGGLPRPEDVQVDGLRPSFSGVRTVGAGPFPVDRVVDVPLQGAGAWLVRLDSDGANTVAWMLRSDLEIDATDRDGMRRLAVRMKSAPFDGAEIRAVGYAGIEATETDIRGVATVGGGAAALAQAGPHAAFTRDAVPVAVALPISGPSYGPSSPSPSLRDRVRDREQQRRAKRQSEYDFIGAEPASAIEASEL